MSLVLCPECGTKISDRATICPHCGFQSADHNRPISEQDRFEVVPFFDYDIDDWSPNRGDLSVISYEDNKRLVSFFGKWENIQNHLPAIAELVEALAKKQNVMVAKMDPFIKDQIKKGILRFSIDKNGEILPTIRGAEGIVKQVRLENMNFSPNLLNSLNNLATHAMMARILDEIEFIGDSILGLHIELQNDRIALAESAKDKLRQARLIQDRSLREQALLQAISSATDAKRALMRVVSQNIADITNHSQAPFKLTKRNELSSKAIDGLQSLMFISWDVQTECEGYAMLGEYESCRECLNEFKQFIIGNRLNQRDTLLMLGEYSSRNDNEIINGLSDVVNRITAFDLQTDKLCYQTHELLISSTGETVEGVNE